MTSNIEDNADVPTHGIPLQRRSIRHHRPTRSNLEHHRDNSIRTIAFPFPLSDLEVLEQDKWISRVWTYQELVKGADAYFTTTDPNIGTPVIQLHRFLNCVGSSLNKWKKENEQSETGVRENFLHLSILEDALGEILEVFSLILGFETSIPISTEQTPGLPGCIGEGILVGCYIYYSRATSGQVNENLRG